MTPSHWHCPHECEHPQDITDEATGDHWGGRCWFTTGIRTLMEPCIPSVCEDQQEVVEMPPLADSRAAEPEWRCFHCDEVFKDPRSASEHFGASEIHQPACRVDIAEYRRMEEAYLRHCQEDTELHRALHAKDSEIYVAVRRAEEDGYGKGLQEGRAEAALARRAADEIVGWIVHSRDIEHAALYNLSEKDKAMDAAIRWGACITAVYPAIAIDGVPPSICGRLRNRYRIHTSGAGEMSDTPRADAEALNVSGTTDQSDGFNCVVTYDFARTLERELAILSTANAELDKQAKDLADDLGTVVQENMELVAALRSYVATKDSMRSMYGLPIGGDAVMAHQERCESELDNLRVILAKYDKIEEQTVSDPLLRLPMGATYWANGKVTETDDNQGEPT